MAELRFYQFDGAGRFDTALATLLEQALAEGERIVVQVGTQERVEALDAALWTYSDDSFLPHGTSRQPAPEGQPVLLTTESDNPNGATMRVLLDGVAPPDDAAPYKRIEVLFDASDEDLRTEARRLWAAAKAAGTPVSHWQRDDSGRWQRRG